MEDVNGVSFSMWDILLFISKYSKPLTRRIYKPKKYLLIWARCRPKMIFAMLSYVLEHLAVDFLEFIVGLF